MTGPGGAVLVAGAAAGTVWFLGYPGAAWVAVVAAALLAPALIWRLLPGRRSAVALDVPGRVTRGDAVEVRIAVRPARRTVRLAGCVLGEPVDRPVRGESASVTVTAVTRGVRRSEMDRVTAIGPWGLATRPLRPPTPAETLVLPRRQPLDPPRPIGSADDDGPAGTGRGGIEFGGLREYAAGDDPRLINWAASARTGDGTLMIRQNVLARVAGYHVVLDPAAVGAEAFETAVDLTYSIVCAVHQAPGNRLTVTALTDGGPEHAAGFAAAERLLARARPGAWPGGVAALLPRRPQPLTRVLVTAGSGAVPAGRLVVFRIGPAAPMRRTHSITTFTVPDLAAAGRAWSWLVRA